MKQAKAAEGIASAFVHRCTAPRLRAHLNSRISRYRLLGGFLGGSGEDRIQWPTLNCPRPEGATTPFNQSVRSVVTGPPETSKGHSKTKIACRPGELADKGEQGEVSPYN